MLTPVMFAPTGRCPSTDPVPGARDCDHLGPLHVLLVEDSPSDAMLMEIELRDAAPDCVVEIARTLATALTAVGTGSHDVVLLDLGLPDSEGLDTFRVMARAAPHIAIVVLSGLNDQHAAETAVLLGAQDCLIKGTTTPGQVVRSMTYAVRRNQILEDLHRLRDAQLEEKDRFLSHVSHELRSPLAVIHQFASLLHDGIGGPLTAEQVDYIDVTMRNIDQLRLMIDDLLDVGRLASGHLVPECAPAQLDGLLTECIHERQPTASERSITVALTVPSPLRTAMCDARRTREVVDNLLDNALKFSADGSSIEVAASGDADCLRISVRDAGRGISAENLDRVFEQFFQEPGADETPRHGLGLGLFISRQIVERQGGRIWIESTVGEGTTVTFTVPLAQRADHDDVQDSDR